METVRRAKSSKEESCLAVLTAMPASAKVEAAAAAVLGAAAGAAAADAW